MGSRKQRINPKTLKKDLDAYAVFKTMSDYRPSNPEFTREKVDTVKSEMDEMHEEEAQMLASLAGLRDRIRAKEWEFHDKMSGVKDQSIAQYGRDSDQIQALGLTKISERRSRARSTPNNNNQPNS